MGRAGRRAGFGPRGYTGFRRPGIGTRGAGVAVAAPVGGLAVGPGGFQPPPAPAAAQQPGQQVPPRGRPGAQLYTTAANLLRDPQPADSPLPAPARRILPIVVQGGQFPVNPLTIYYIREQLTAEGLPSAGPIEPLIILDLEELEGCQALHHRRGTTLPL